jgi:hypothetical protein
MNEAGMGRNKWRERIIEQHVGRTEHAWPVGGPQGLE